MTRRIVRKIVFSLITMLLVSAFVFLLQEFTLGDGAGYYLPEDADSSVVEAYKSAHGLNGNIFRRYIYFLSSFFTFDWGLTLNGMDVESVILSRFPATIEIAVLSLLISLLISLPWTIAAVVKRDGFLSKAHSIFSTATMAFPSFLIALLLSYVFALKLKLFPVAGYKGMSEGFFKSLQTVFLPSLTLAVLHSSLFMRVFKASLIDNLERPYTLALKAQGADDFDLVVHSALKPALPVMLSLIAESLASSFSGAVIVESVFAIPGIGSLLVKAAESRDVHLSGTILMILALVVSLLYLLASIISAAIDPRVKGDDR